ncbi:MAG: 30S ribosomal protein S4 [Candidatus Nealsonbacteria bacterium]
MINSKCKICRRQGVKLFLKGEKCFSPKCSIIKKPYAPGPKKTRRFRSLSEYGKELKEKQKLKNWYNLSEKQFVAYVAKTLAARRKVENTADYLIKILETRLDNVVFRLGLAVSRSAARQLISHKHFLINGKPNNIPSHQVKKGDVISLKLKSLERKSFKDVQAGIKKYTPPSWLELKVDKMEGKVIGEPTLQEASPPAEIASIFEFYSR